MSNFEFHLQKIADYVRNPRDARNANDFFAVKDHVLDIMRKQSPYFNKICQRDILFGSMGHDVRIYDDDELDVLMELQFPGYDCIVQLDQQQRPGFMYLDFTQASGDTMITQRLANNDRRFLNRACLKVWLDNVFRNALQKYGNVVQGDWDNYELSYAWRGIPYTIRAKSPSRTFYVDFVPALKIVRPKSGTWHAVPKHTKAPGNMHRFGYLLSNAQAELAHVDRCGQVLRDAVRLLQALRDSKGWPQLRCYHFISVAIWLSRRIGHQQVANMWLSELFITLLGDLRDAFIDGHLGYVWNSQLNLLANFGEQDLDQYTQDLCSAYATLESYLHSQTLSYKRCCQHFL